MPPTQGRPFPAEVAPVMATEQQLPVIDFEAEVEHHRTLLRGDLKILSYKAKREMPRVGTPRYPTPWDRLHAAIDAKLTELQALG
jgi:hypothetical protein